MLLISEQPGNVIPPLYNIMGIGGASGLFFFFRKCVLRHTDRWGGCEIEHEGQLWSMAFWINNYRSSNGLSEA